MIIYKFLSRNYKIISFDIFDTLIQRQVDIPSDIFYLAGKNVLGDSAAECFRQARINAERTARTETKNKDVTIQEIYDNLQGYDYYKKELMQREIEEEIENCMPLTRRISFAKELKKSGKIIVLITDMYLPDYVLSKMLKNCGIDFYDGLYISSKLNSCKLDGSLFEVVLKEWNIVSKDIIHFGDSFKADVIGARKKGIKGLIVSRKNRLMRLLKK